MWLRRTSRAQDLDPGDPVPTWHFFLLFITAALSRAAQRPLDPLVWSSFFDTTSMLLLSAARTCSAAMASAPSAPHRAQNPHSAFAALQASASPSARFPPLPGPTTGSSPVCEANSGVFRVVHGLWPLQPRPTKKSCAPHVRPCPARHKHQRGKRAPLDRREGTRARCSWGGSCCLFSFALPPYSHSHSTSTPRLQYACDVRLQYACGVRLQYACGVRLQYACACVRWSVLRCLFNRHETRDVRLQYACDAPSMRVPLQ